MAPNAVRNSPFVDETEPGTTEEDEINYEFFFSSELTHELGRVVSEHRTCQRRMRHALARLPARF